MTHPDGEIVEVGFEEGVQLGLDVPLGKLVDGGGLVFVLGDDVDRPPLVDHRPDRLDKQIGVQGLELVRHVDDAEPFLA